MGSFSNPQNLNFEHFGADYNHNFNLKNEEHFGDEDSNKLFPQYNKSHLSPGLPYPQICDNSINYFNKSKEFIEEVNDQKPNVQKKKEKNEEKMENDRKKETRYKNFFKQTYVEKIKKLMQNKQFKKSFPIKIIILNLE